MAYPSLTVSALRTVLAVARADSPLSYQELANILGQAYIPLAHQVAALSDGRDKRAGLGLLERLQGKHERARLVSCSSVGRSNIVGFTAEPGRPMADKEKTSLILERTLSALNVVIDRNPKITLGSLCTYLYIATHQEDFAYEGLPVRKITKDLQVSNLPKHLKVLELGIEGKPGSRLIHFHINEYDQRIRLPRLTEPGINLQCELVERLTGLQVDTPRSPRAEALDALDAPDDVRRLTDEDFDDILWE